MAASDAVPTRFSGSVRASPCARCPCCPSSLGRSAHVVAPCTVPAWVPGRPAAHGPGTAQALRAPDASSVQRAGLTGRAAGSEAAARGRRVFGPLVTRRACCAPSCARAGLSILKMKRMALLPWGRIQPWRGWRGDGPCDKH